jgi:hypothetical protein
MLLNKQTWILCCEKTEVYSRLVKRTSQRDTKCWHECSINPPGNPDSTVNSVQNTHGREPVLANNDKTEKPKDAYATKGNSTQRNCRNRIASPSIQKLLKSLQRRQQQNPGKKDSKTRIQSSLQRAAVGGPFMALCRQTGKERRTPGYAAIRRSIPVWQQRTRSDDKPYNRTSFVVYWSHRNTGKTWNLCAKQIPRMHATGAKLNSLGQTQQSNLLGIQDPDPGIPVKNAG